MNLMPLVSSNLWAARMRPRLPSLIRSASETPWFWYFLATDTTNRRLLRTSLSSASSSPTRIRCARLTSSSCGISGYLLISRRYWSSEPSSNDGPRLPEPTCIGRMRLDLVLIWGVTRIAEASRYDPSIDHGWGRPFPEPYPAFRECAMERNEVRVQGPGPSDLGHEKFESPIPKPLLSTLDARSHNCP